MVSHLDLVRDDGPGRWSLGCQLKSTLQVRLIEIREDSVCRMRFGLRVDVLQTLVINKRVDSVAIMVVLVQEVDN